MIPCYIDTETTGLDPHYHDVLTVGIVPLTDDWKIDETRQPFYAKVRARHPERADKRALEINKLDPNVGDDPTMLGHRIETWMEEQRITKILPIGHNWVFDRNMLEFNVFCNHDRFSRGFHYAYLDTKVFFEFLRQKIAQAGFAKPFGASLAECIKYFGIETEQTHEVMSDIYHGIAVLQHLQNAFTINWSAKRS